MSWIDSLRKTEIDWIIGTQNSLFKYEDLMGRISTVFGPTFMFVFIIPCLSAFNTRLYHKALISCIISDFLNLILKWIINEDRPYWWVHETSAYTALTRPTLYQTERTCETSPGSPSGHMMMSASLLFIMLLATEKFIVMKCPNHRRKLRYLARIVYTFVLVVLGFSRMYFAAHFFHQCVFGALLGISISEAVSFMRYTDNFGRMKRNQWFKIGCAMGALVAAIFWLLKLITGNPMASVQMAFKYCTDPLYPKPETTVMFSAIRIIAMIFGLFLSAPLSDAPPPDPKLLRARLQTSAPEVKLSLVRSIPVTAVLIIAQWQLILWTPKTFKLLVFYAYTFAVYSIFQFLFLTIIPKLCAQKSEATEKPKTN